MAKWTRNKDNKATLITMRFPFLWIISERGLNRSQLNCMARINVSLADGMSCCLSDKRSLLKMHCLTVSTKIWVETIKACLRTGIIKKKNFRIYRVNMICMAFLLYSESPIHFDPPIRLLAQVTKLSAATPVVTWLLLFHCLTRKKTRNNNRGKKKREADLYFSH